MNLNSRSEHEYCTVLCFVVDDRAVWFDQRVVHTLVCLVHERHANQFAIVRTRFTLQEHNRYKYKCILRSNHLLNRKTCTLVQRYIKPVSVILFDTSAQYFLSDLTLNYAVALMSIFNFIVQYVQKYCIKCMSKSNQTVNLTSVLIFRKQKTGRNINKIRLD